MSTALKIAAEGLGLAYIEGDSRLFTREVPAGPVAAGILDGVPVTGGSTYTGNAQIGTAVAAIFPPLDLGLDLQVDQSGLRRAVLDLFRSKELEIGDEAFDAAVRVLADERERVRALLTLRARAAVLELADGAGDSFFIGDGGVAIQRPTGILAPMAWRPSLLVVARTARILRDVASAVPAAAGLAAWVEPTRAYAASYGLGVATTPLSAWGSLGGLEIGLFFRRLDPGRYALEVGTIVDASMAFDLEIRPRAPTLPVQDVLLPIYRLAMRDVTLGDPGIDRRFVISTSRPLDALSDALPGRARLLMARLSSSFDVTLRFGVLSLRRAIDTFSPAQLAEVIDAAVEGARTLVPTLRGSYRDAARGG